MDGGWRDQIKSEVEVGTETQMASAPDPMDALNDMSMNVYGKPLHELTPEQYQMLIDMANDQASAPNTGVIDQNTNPQEVEQLLGIMLAAAPQIEDRNKQSAEMFKLMQGAAHGGRIGYREGIGPNQGSPSIMAEAITDSEVEDAYGVSVEDAALLSEIRQIAEQSVSPPDFPATDSDYEALEVLSNKHNVDLEVVIQMAKTTNFPTPEQSKGEMYAQYMARGGRIGLQGGANDPKNMTTTMLISIVKDGRSTPEILIELEKRIPGAIEQLKLEEGQGDQAFSINQEMLSNYDPDKRAVEESFLYDLRENIDPNYKEPKDFVGYLDNAQYAQGGRIKKAPGGIMNLGGLEKDYRTTGGFVPIGAYEKKDDVPARLSKNEFVMTADAVRAAGGGSINRGAQRMYDTMKNLEASPQARRMTA